MLSATDARGWEILEPVLHVCGQRSAATNTTDTVTATMAPALSCFMAVDLGRFRVLERIMAMVKFETYGTF